ncbi:hypothetical protein PIB30_098356 [Stylosanthes scabra]|uniref:Uncharacterized protein n=1 Tax=Stylosanthes scabra TaxID=79078 RepID=A0ABU6YU98_9FABA|nr:hypothetical protein [Stylosanthes scabra]
MECGSQWAGSSPISGSFVSPVGPPSWVAIPSRGGVTVARAAVVSSPPREGAGSLSPFGLWGGFGSLVPSGWGTRLGSGMSPRRCLGPGLRVLCAGSKFGVPFLNSRTSDSIACMRCLSSWAIWDSSEPILPKGRGWVHSVQSDRRRFVYCLGLGSEGALVAAVGSDVDRRQSGRCKPRLLHLGRPLSVTLRQFPQTAPMYGMYLRGVWDYRRNRWCQDGRFGGLCERGSCEDEAEALSSIEGESSSR